MRNEKRVKAVLILAFIIVIASILFVVQAVKKNAVQGFPEYMLKRSELTQEIGKTKKIIKKTDYAYIAVYYPKLGKKAIDQEIKNYVNEVMQLFEKENKDRLGNGKAELYVDYESFSLNKQYVSVVLNIEIRGIINKKQVKTWFFDLAGDRQMFLNDLFSSNYLNRITSLTRSFFTHQNPISKTQDNARFQSRTEPLEENFTEFALNGEELLLYFEPQSLFEDVDEELIAKIPLNRLQKYLNESFRDIIEITEETGRFVDPDLPMVALTYDDGPNPDTTDRILSALEKNKSAATFFLLGSRVHKYPEVVRRMAELQCELGNHGFGHQDLSRMSQDKILDQINATQQAIVEVAGERAAPVLIRPPYGNFNDVLKKTVEMPLILWSIDPRDWSTMNADRTVQHILDNVQDGSIILMHDMFEPSAAASEKLIEQLVEKGYQLVTISEMFEAKGIELKAGETYHSTKY